MKRVNILSWVFRIIAAVILLQTLFFKFTAAPESVFIFSQLGIEPWGRISTGVAELIVSILLLLPRTAWVGAVGGLAVISGAIFAHIFSLGVEVQNDGGLLFFLALIVFISCLIVVIIHKEKALKFLTGIK